LCIFVSETKLEVTLHNAIMHAVSRKGYPYLKPKGAWDTMLWIVIRAAIGLLEKHSGRLKVSKILAWCDANLQSSHGL
jgi:hypothetical protein